MLAGSASDRGGAAVPGVASFNLPARCTALLLAYCLCYFPTIALTNSLTLRNITNVAGQFPLIRVFATIGWIVIGLVVGYMGVERTATPFLLAAGFSVVMSLLQLDAATHASRGERASDFGGEAFLDSMRW